MWHMLYVYFPNLFIINLTSRGIMAERMAFGAKSRSQYIFLVDFFGRIDSESAVLPVLSTIFTWAKYRADS